MTPSSMRRRRIGVLAVVVLVALATVTYKVVTWTPREVGRTAVEAVQADNPGKDDDEWRVSCDGRGERAFVCVVTWKQVDIAPADAPGDFCEDFRVEVRDGRATEPVRLEGEDGISLRRC